jgi:hypothetical protein
MQPIDYYESNPIFYPNKADYITLYVYDKGECVWSGPAHKNSKSVLKKDYPDAVIQEIFDRDGYTENIKEYNRERLRLEEEFKNDLFKLHRVSDNPKRFKCFELAWDRGHANGLGDVVYQFDELVELIKD